METATRTSRTRTSPRRHKSQDADATPHREAFVECDLHIDHSDPWLYEDHGDMPTLPEGKEYFTLEELRSMLKEDLREIYGIKDEVYN